MIDKDYFLTVLPAQLESIGGRGRLTIRTMQGDLHDVCRLAFVGELYMVIEVWSPDGREEQRPEAWKDAHPGESPFLCDQIVIQYGLIVDVRLSPRRADKDAPREIGFTWDLDKKAP